MKSRDLRALTIQKNSAQKLLRVLGIPLSIQRDFVFLLDLETRMRQSLREIAVVREQEQTFTLRVETANVEEPRKFRRQQIEDRVARVRIASRRDKPRRFMERDRQRAFNMNELAVHLYVIALGRLRAEVCADAPVDRHLAGHDQLVTFAPRTDAGGGEKTI
jgi:hypothetical protein